ncbi:MAG: hypothetical protein FIA95_14530 [Gemmatimonadetes bacterium]|nr:hypothetical protein [Gemmatimonadota bacterium]
MTSAAALAVAWLATPAPAAAHCDSLDGPVVQAARAALVAGDVRLVLHWVRAQDEAEIREAFQRTVRVRQAGGEAAEVADRWFFETLVRVRRAGEGAPYTGLRPAGEAPAPGVAAADQALLDASADALSARLAEHVASAVAERWEAVRRLSGYDPSDVEAGRAWVEAYVSYVHFVEELVGIVHGAGGHKEGA